MDIAKKISQFSYTAINTTLLYIYLHNNYFNPLFFRGTTYLFIFYK